MRITPKSEYHLDFGADLNLSIDIMTKFMPYFLMLWNGILKLTTLPHRGRCRPNRTADEEQYAEPTRRTPGRIRTGQNDLIIIVFLLCNLMALFSTEQSQPVHTSAVFFLRLPVSFPTIHRKTPQTFHSLWSFSVEKGAIFYVFNNPGRKCWKFPLLFP